MPARDPTDVLGRRIVAYVIDIALVLGVGALLLASAKYSSFYGAPSNACKSFHSSMCFQLNDHVYVWKHSAFVRSELVSTLVAFLDLVVLQTLTGASIGKLCMGLRVVDALGHPAGFLRTFGRTALLAVDGACFLVGLVAVLGTHPHRRVGDLACGTYVVSKAHVGRLIFVTKSPSEPAEITSWRRGWSPTGFDTPESWSPPSVTRGRESPWEKPPPRRREATLRRRMRKLPLRQRRRYRVQRHRPSRLRRRRRCRGSWTRRRSRRSRRRPRRRRRTRPGHHRAPTRRPCRPCRPCRPRRSGCATRACSSGTTHPGCAGTRAGCAGTRSGCGAAGRAGSNATDCSRATGSRAARSRAAGGRAGAVEPGGAGGGRVVAFRAAHVRACGRSGAR